MIEYEVNQVINTDNGRDYGTQEETTRFNEQVNVMKIKDNEIYVQDNETE